MIKRLVTRYWLLLPLLIFTVVLIDRVDTPDTVVTEDTIDMRTTESDYYLSEFKTRKYNADGAIEYLLEGDTLAHYTDDDRSQIVNPRVELRRDEVRWLMSSNEGRYDPQPNLFTLTGDVKLRRLLQSAQNTNDAQSVVMKTEALQISTEENIVATDQSVEIVAPTWQLQAKGFRSEIDDGQLQLLADVVGRYHLPER